MPNSPPRHNAKKVEENRLANQRIYNKEKRTGQEFYNSKRWSRVRRAYAKANPLCVHCKEQGFIVAMNVVDHIIPIKEGGDLFSESNLQSLCKTCHGKKTADEQIKK